MSLPAHKINAAINTHQSTGSHVSNQAIILNWKISGRVPANINCGRHVRGDLADRRMRMDWTEEQLMIVGKVEKSHSLAVLKFLGEGRRREKGEGKRRKGEGMLR